MKNSREIILLATIIATVFVTNIHIDKVEYKVNKIYEQMEVTYEE